MPNGTFAKGEFAVQRRERGARVFLDMPFARHVSHGLNVRLLAVFKRPSLQLVKAEKDRKRFRDEENDDRLQVACHYSEVLGEPHSFLPESESIMVGLPL